MQEPRKLNSVPVPKTLAQLDKRRAKFLIDNKIPKLVNIYDNGGVDNPKGSIDRYTAVFKGRYRRTVEEEFLYLAMNGEPFHPQGFCQHGSSKNHAVDTDPRTGFPRYSHLGKKIKFVDLPLDCQKAVYDDYIDIWNLRDPRVDPEPLPYVSEYYYDLMVKLGKEPKSKYGKKYLAEKEKAA